VSATHESQKRPDDLRTFPVVPNETSPPIDIDTRVWPRPKVEDDCGPMPYRRNPRANHESASMSFITWTRYVGPAFREWSPEDCAAAGW
jgi:hypothetical protein